MATTGSQHNERMATEWGAGMSNTLRHLSLFSGVGCTELGMMLAGMDFKTVMYCEIDKYCQKVLRKRMEDGVLDTAPVHDDVTTLTAEMCGQVDIISGGFPCQDISCAGKGAGLKGARSGLFYEIIRLIGDLRPRYILLENVAALLSGKEHYEYPPDKCLCGWPYRWRRMHFGSVRHIEEGENGVFCEDRCGDVGKGRGVIAQPQKTLGRDGAPHQAKVGQVGGGKGVDGMRKKGTAVSGGNPVRAKTETGTSEVGDNLTGNSHLDEGEVDGHCTETVCGYSWDDNGIEPKGAAASTGQRELVCEACGRLLDDGASRHVQRYWFSAVLGELAEAGYDACWTSVRASDVGAPHRRERVFILCQLADSASIHAQGHLLRQGTVQPRGGCTKLADSNNWQGNAAIEQKPVREAFVQPSAINRAGSTAERAHMQGGKSWQQAEHEGREDTGRRGEESTDRQELWPLGYGAEQHDWEPPRLVGNAKKPDGRQQNRHKEKQAGRTDQSRDKTKSRLGRGIDGPTNRVGQLRSLGNGIVPQQLAAAIRELFEMMETAQ